MQAEGARVAHNGESLQKHQVAQREVAIERMLVAWAAGGSPDVLRLVLSGNDPDMVARCLPRPISRAAASLLAAQRAASAELERLAGDAKARAERLRAIEQASRTDRDRLLSEQRSRARCASVSAEILKNRKEIRVLRADEARLARIIEALGAVSSLGQGGLSRLARQAVSLPVRGN